MSKFFCVLKQQQNNLDVQDIKRNTIVVVNNQKKLY